MGHAAAPGQIVILNGAPRSGKSSIVAVIQDTFDGPWMNLGVDVLVRQVTPARYRPGIGLRPGGERPDLEPFVAASYAACFASIAAHSRLGLNVVADVGLHDVFAAGLDVLHDAALRLAGLPVLFVGVRCPIEVIMQRRNAGEEGREGGYLTGPVDAPPEPVRRWQEAVHAGHDYDIEVDTSVLSAQECAATILERLRGGRPGSAFHRYAVRTGA